LTLKETRGQTERKYKHKGNQYTKQTKEDRKEEGKTSKKKVE
jgi:hypothetical protein